MMNKHIPEPEARSQARKIPARLVRLKQQMSWKHAFTALRYRNYRLWFWGQMISLFGSWMQSTAQAFLLFQLTHSPAWLGYLGFANGIPSWIFMLFAGVIADRVNRRNLMTITQTSMMILAFILAGLTFAHQVQPWHIIILSFCLGTANAFEAPTRHAFVSEMVDREDMTNAIALNSTMFNTATAVGPAAAGITYALFGPAWCFAINGVSFLAVISALRMMRLERRPRIPRNNGAIADLKEGLRYVRSHTTIRSIIGLVLVTSLFGFAFATLIPAWAVKILHGGARTNGWLQSARGVGALLCALFIASLGRFKFKGKLISLGSLGFPLILAGFAFVRWLPLSLFFLLSIGFSIILIFNLANALVQTLVEDSLRGRVMALYSLTFFGMVPIGALLAGVVAEHLSEPAAVLINAGIMLMFSFLIWTKVPQIRKLE